MNCNGTIILASGKTQELFKKHKIEKLHDFIEPTEELTRLGCKLNPICRKSKNLFVEAFSPITQKWYQIRFKPNTDPKNPESCLVWFQDISVRKFYDIRLSRLFNFSKDLLNQVSTLSRGDSIYSLLADFLLQSHYQAVFITHLHENGDLIGNAFEIRNDQIQKSQEIIIPKSSTAPILLSRKKSKVIYATHEDFQSQEQFENQYPFDKQVKNFISRPIKNFINYNEGEITIIAFNYQHTYTQYEIRFIETLVNLYRTMVILVDLARENDEQFLQKVMGLCAASEYSDEITGKHILRVNEYSKFLAEKMGLDQEFIDTISQVAALHDIGKVAIPELIKLERKYTEEERAQMQMHTIYGAQIIQTMISYSSKEDKKLKMAYNIALYHHQIYNGKGYPGLKRNHQQINPESKDYRFYQELTPLSGDEIPLESLITSLADRYDALRSERQYKPEFSHEKALEIIQFDDRLNISGLDWYGEKVWNTFIKYHQEFDKIFTQMRS